MARSKGQGSFFPHVNYSSTICWKDYLFSIKLSWQICVFLVFLFCVNDPWICPYTNATPHTVLITVPFIESHKIKWGDSSNFDIVFQYCFGYSRPFALQYKSEIIILSLWQDWDWLGLRQFYRSTKRIYILIY